MVRAELGTVLGTGDFGNGDEGADTFVSGDWGKEEDTTGRVAEVYAGAFWAGDACGDKDELLMTGDSGLGIAGGGGGAGAGDLFMEAAVWGTPVLAGELGGGDLVEEAAGGDALVISGDFGVVGVAEVGDATGKFKGAGATGDDGAVAAAGGGGGRVGDTAAGCTGGLATATGGLKGDIGGGGWGAGVGAGGRAGAGAGAGAEAGAGTGAGGAAGRMMVANRNHGRGGCWVDMVVLVNFSQEASYSWINMYSCLN